MPVEPIRKILTDDATGGGSGVGAVFSGKLTAGITVGGVTSGDEFAQGSKIEDFIVTLVQGTLVPQLPPLPSNLLPSLALAQDQTIDAATTEAGSLFDITFTPDYTPAGAGDVVSFKIQSRHYNPVNEVWDEWTDIADETSVPSSLLVNNVQIGDQTELRAVVEYAAGSKYSGGTVESSEISLSTSRCLYWGWSQPAQTTSAIIRGLANVIFNPQEGTQFNIPPMILGVGYLGLWYPASIRDVNSIFQVGFMEMKEAFDPQTPVFVEGANGFTAIEYKGFAYQVTVPYVIEDNWSLNVTL
jgi:hypothetical protein